MNKLLVARSYGLVIGLIALVLGLLAWFDSVRFAHEAGIALGATDFGTLMAVKFIGNLNVSTEALILILLFMKQHRALGALLLVRGLINLFDAFLAGHGAAAGHRQCGNPADAGGGLRLDRSELCLGALSGEGQRHFKQ